MFSERTTTIQCPVDDIASYIDGELDPASELDLDRHFAACGECLSELNRQKQFLCGLDVSLSRDGEIELPENFTKLVVANAESTVSGLRRPGERFNALFISLALLLFVLFALGPDIHRVMDGATVLLEQMAIVGGFFGHLIYTFFLGVSIVLRAFASQIAIDRAAEGMVTGGLVIVSFLLMRTAILRLRRA